MAMISNKLRQSAKGEPCTFGIVGHCVGGTETTVLAHAPSEVKGIGNKSPDYWAAFACFGCHTAVDEHRIPADEAREYWLRAIRRTWQRWLDRGLIVVSGIDPDKPKTRPKKPGNWAKGRKIQSANNLRKRA